MSTDKINSSRGDKFDFTATTPITEQLYTAPLNDSTHQFNTEPIDQTSENAYTQTEENAPKRRTKGSRDKRKDNKDIYQGFLGVTRRSKLVDKAKNNNKDNSESIKPSKVEYERFDQTSELVWGPNGMPIGIKDPISDKIEYFIDEVNKDNPHQSEIEDKNFSSNGYSNPITKPDTNVTEQIKDKLVNSDNPNITDQLSKEKKLDNPNNQGIEVISMNNGFVNNSKTSEYITTPLNNIEGLETINYKLKNSEFNLNNSRNITNKNRTENGKSKSPIFPKIIGLLGGLSLLLQLSGNNDKKQTVVEKPGVIRSQQLTTKEDPNIEITSFRNQVITTKEDSDEPIGTRKQGITSKEDPDELMVTRNQGLTQKEDSSYTDIKPSLRSQSTTSKEDGNLESYEFDKYKVKKGDTYWNLINQELNTTIISNEKYNALSQADKIRLLNLTTRALVDTEQVIQAKDFNLIHPGEIIRTPSIEMATKTFDILYDFIYNNQINKYDDETRNVILTVLKSSPDSSNPKLYAKNLSQFHDLLKK